MTQLELAMSAEVERTRISKLENGLVNPSALTLATICHCWALRWPICLPRFGSRIHRPPKAVLAPRQPSGAGQEANAKRTSKGAR
jgi:transcriptional regulator with XRE-family HTH domain